MDKLIVSSEKFIEEFPKDVVKKLNDSQKEGISKIIAHWNQNLQLIDLRWLAYILCTIYYESWFTFQPIRERGKGKGRSYGISVNGVIYYGRGLVQITWLSNYTKFQKLLGVDLIKQPDLALIWPVALDIAFIGMIRGIFTGVKLETYFNANRESWTSARAIINGTDRAEEFAKLGIKFYEILKQQSDAK